MRRTRSGSPPLDLPARLAEIRDALPCGTEIELWFADEAGVGHKTKITPPLGETGTVRKFMCGQAMLSDDASVMERQGCFGRERLFSLVDRT